jgi:sterol desaturase/sphingolipid hydroxylase (fatty acid hydroxylase superfamily)
LKFAASTSTGWGLPTVFASVRTTDLVSCVPAGPRHRLCRKRNRFTTHLACALAAFNKFATTFFVYHCSKVGWNLDTIEWGWETLRLANTVGSLIAFYLTYDLAYTLFHRALHIRAIYPWIHKHHHKQKVKSGRVFAHSKSRGVIEPFVFN